MPQGKSKKFILALSFFYIVTILGLSPIIAFFINSLRFRIPLFFYSI